MTNKIKIFGYGSLINLHSLNKTLPEVTCVTPAILKDYIRIFDTKSTTRFTQDNVAISVLNFKESPNNFMNGVFFDVSKKYFQSLTEREGAYKAKEVTIETSNGKEKFNAIVFIGENNKQDYLFDDFHQNNYLQICINGAKDFGEDFYKTFLDTTLINNKKLSKIREIEHLL